MTTTNETAIRLSLRRARKRGVVFALRVSVEWRPPIVHEHVSVVSEGFPGRDTAWFVVYTDDEDKDLILPYGQFVPYGAL